MRKASSLASERTIADIGRATTVIDLRPKKSDRDFTTSRDSHSGRRFENDNKHAGRVIAYAVPYTWSVKSVGGTTDLLLNTKQRLQCHIKGSQIVVLRSYFA